MIPAFPAFLPLSIAIADEYRQYLAPHPPYADFNLTNRLCWDLDGTTAVSLLNDNLILKLPDYARGGTRITILGVNRLEHTLDVLLGYLEANAITSQLELVPEHVIQRLPDTPSWQTEEDTDNHDHILSTSRLINMSGPALRHYRRAVRAFLRRYESTVSFHKLDATCPVTQESMLYVFLKRVSSKQAYGPVHELLALQNLFGIAEHMKLVTYGLSVRGALQAFIICEPMNATWAIGHFWKADTGLTGIYSYLMHCTAGHLLRQGFEYLNTQQDLGIEGLRTFKHSLSPITCLRKYTLKHRPAYPPVAQVPETLPR